MTDIDKDIINNTKTTGRLHKKILLMMLAVGILPVLIAGLFSLYSVTNSHERSVASIEENLINQKAEEVRAFIDVIAKALNMQVSFRNIDVDFNKSQQEILLTGLLEAYSPIEEAYFIHKDSGFETARVSKEHDKFLKSPELRDFSNIEGYKELKSEIEEEGQDLQRSIETKRQKTPYLYIGKVNMTLNGPIVSIFSNVRNAAGENISIIGADVNLSGIESIVDTSKLGETGYVYVIDEEKRIIASSIEEPKPSIDKGVPYEFGKDFMGYDSVKEYAGLFGKGVIASGRFIDEPRLGIIAEWPVDDANSVLANLRYQIVLFSIFALIAVTILSAVLASKIVQPIKILEEGTARVAEGKFDQPVIIKTNDEIEELGEAFNKMTEGLKQLQALKDEFVFIAAHELKTPVAAIKGYLSIINDGLAGPVSDKVRGFIEKVLNANGRLIRLVEDLLEVARADAGKIKVDVMPTAIPPVVEETISELQPLADEKGINLVYEDHDKDIPKAMADSGRIREVLVNLMGNSIKYTLPKEGQNNDIEISHEIKDGMLITHVKDHGLGMSKEAQEKLFQKFYRVQTKDTAGITGTGLGLFIVKQIIEKMNGEIKVESEEGKGSTFSFSLPIVK